jgi:hypothetical protein
MDYDVGFVFSVLQNKMRKNSQMNCYMVFLVSGTWPVGQRPGTNATDRD